MNIGFTGTRNGMTPEQSAVFERLCLGRCNFSNFHHGACVGADTDAVRKASRDLRSYRIVAHPGVSAKGGANEHLSQEALRLSDAVLPAKTHFARNRDIVDASDMLIAAPWQNERPAKGTGGGTWYTVEYAERKDKMVFILWPDGQVTSLNGIEFETVDD